MNAFYETVKAGWLLLLYIALENDFAGLIYNSAVYEYLLVQAKHINYEQLIFTAGFPRSSEKFSTCSMFQKIPNKVMGPLKVCD